MECDGVGRADEVLHSVLGASAGRAALSRMAVQLAGGGREGSELPRAVSEGSVEYSAAHGKESGTSESHGLLLAL